MTGRKKAHIRHMPTKINFRKGQLFFPKEVSGHMST